MIGPDYEDRVNWLGAIPLKTIREAKLDNMLLRLVESNNSFIGVIFVDGRLKLQIDGGSANDIWRRLHDEAGKAKPK
jgi:hypothetical protein